MKTITIEEVSREAVANTPHEALLRLQTEVEQAVAQANAQAEAEARQRAAAVRKTAQTAPQDRVRFAYD